jgi:organic hydroperoxide reductase OsmC/OhrA
MSEYFTEIDWELKPGEDFAGNKYSRGHLWRFDGGTEVIASSSPQVVPLPDSVEEAVDPEEAFVASLSSCHMLWFLSLAAKHRFVVIRYIDKAVGTMARNDEGKLAMTEVILRPAVDFAKDSCPDHEQLASLHHETHDRCFIANSVKTDVRVELA